jgi:hypothetical protein
MREDARHIRLDLTEAEFDDHVVDLHVYTGLPLVRLDVTTNIGRVHLRHPGTQDSKSMNSRPAIS